MDYLVKIEQKKRYLRITIPSKIVEEMGIKKYPYAKVRRTSKNTIEVEGVEIKEREKADL